MEGKEHVQMCVLNATEVLIQVKGRPEEWQCGTKQFQNPECYGCYS